MAENGFETSAAAGIWGVFGAAFGGSRGEVAGGAIVRFLNGRGFIQFDYQFFPIGHFQLPFIQKLLHTMREAFGLSHVERNCCAYTDREFRGYFGRRDGGPMEQRLLLSFFADRHRNKRLLDVVIPPIPVLWLVRVMVRHHHPDFWPTMIKARG
jgi:hypothetical protein